MFNKNEKNMCETEAAFTLVMFLMNILILVIIGTSAWLANAVIADNNALNSLMRGGFLP